MNGEHIKTFYNFLRHEGNGYTELRALTPTTDGRSSVAENTWIDNYEDFQEFCNRHNGTSNIYCGINPREKGKSSILGVSALTGIVIDVDSVYKDKHLRPATKEELSLAFEYAKKVRSYIETEWEGEGIGIAMSGNGYHVSIPIKPTPLTEENRHNIANKLNEFQKCIQKKFPEAKIDSIGDLPRIIKIIGTTSLKPHPTEERPNRTTEWIIKPDTRRKNESLLEKIKNISTIDADNILEPEPVTDEDLKEILRKAPRAIKLYQKNGAAKGSRSEPDFSLAIYLARNLVPKEQVKQVLMNVPGSKTLERPESYFTNTYNKAKIAAAKDLDDAELLDYQKNERIKELETEKTLVFDNNEKSEIASKIADKAMEDNTYITHTKTDTLWVYNEDEGRYIEDQIAAYPQAYIEKLKIMVVTVSKGEIKEKDVKISKHLVSEAIGHIKRRTYLNEEGLEKFDKPNPRYVNLKNGIYDFDTKNLITHSPTMYMKEYVPVKYDPKATCENVEKFLSEVLTKEDTKQIEELLGYCLKKEYPFQSTFIMLGYGSNGKSTLMQVFEEFLGKTNVSNQTLNALVNERFNRAELYGKLANLCGDLPRTKTLKDTGYLKQLCGGDYIQAEKKHQPLFKFKNYAKLVFVANELPEIDDPSDAFWRRIVVIDFPNQFLGDKAKPQHELIASMTTEKEKSGLLNVALKGAERLYERGHFQESRTMKENKEAWNRKSNPVKAFIEEYCDLESAEAYVTKQEFKRSLMAFCKEVRARPPNDTKIKEELEKLGVFPARPKISGKQIPVWEGIRITYVYESGNTYKTTKNDSKKDGVAGVAGVPYILLEKNENKEEIKKEERKENIEKDRRPLQGLQPQLCPLDQIIEEMCSREGGATPDQIEIEAWIKGGHSDQDTQKVLRGMENGGIIKEGADGKYQKVNKETGGA